MIDVTHVILVPEDRLVLHRWSGSHIPIYTIETLWWKGYCSSRSAARQLSFNSSLWKRVKRKLDLWWRFKWSTSKAPSAKYSSFEMRNMNSATNENIVHVLTSSFRACGWRGSPIQRHLVRPVPWSHSCPSSTLPCCQAFLLKSFTAYDSARSSVRWISSEQTNRHQCNIWSSYISLSLHFHFSEFHILLDVTIEHPNVIQARRHIFFTSPCEGDLRKETRSLHFFTRKFLVTWNSSS